MKTRLDLRTPRRIHIVGVGGPGMSAIAFALAGMGHSVSGSDIRESPVLDRLRGVGVAVSIGHDATAIQGCDRVTASPAIPSTNVEVAAALGIDSCFMTRAQMLAAICAVAPTLAVAGTHGKTTTTSLLVHIFDTAGLHPNFVVGGDLKNFDTNARWSNGVWTIVEADESDGTHLQLPLAGTVLTNIDVDHLDHYGDLEGIVDAFDRYLEGIDGPKVVCLDDTRIAEMVRTRAPRHPSMRSSRRAASWITYGSSEDAMFRYTDIEAQSGRMRFRLLGPDIEVDVTTSLRGRHNAANITAAVALAVVSGIDPTVAANAVETFSGVGRRFDIRGEIDEITLVDDYAHLPMEIDAVLTAARTSGDGWRRIVAVFQPNRFNRMSEISAEYADAFRSADVVVVTDIYASGTAVIEGVTGHLVVDAVVHRHPETEIHWVQSRRDLASYVSGLLEAGDVCISMGCGDIEHLPTEILSLRGSVGDS